MLSTTATRAADIRYLICVPVSGRNALSNEAEAAEWEDIVSVNKKYLYTKKNFDAFVLILKVLFLSFRKS